MKRIKNSSHTKNSTTNFIVLALIATSLAVTGCVRGTGMGEVGDDSSRSSEPDPIPTPTVSPVPTPTPSPTPTPEPSPTPTATPTPSLGWSPGSNAFGAVQRGFTSAAVTFTLSNAGDGAATGCSAPTLSNSIDFKITEDNCGTADLTAGANCTVKVAANPQQAYPSGGLATTLSRTCTVGDTASTSADQITTSVDVPATLTPGLTITNANRATYENKYWIINNGVTVTLQLATPIAVSWLDLNTGGVLTHPHTGGAEKVDLDITGSALINGSINVSNRGAIGSVGWGQKGATHAGQGNDGVAPYGNPFAPLSLGGGGESYEDPECGYVQGGYGGGVVHLKIAGLLTLNGSITATGGAGSFMDDGYCTTWGGQGAGGSIFIEADRLATTGAPVLNASAGAPGASSTSAGGGGRIAIIYNDAGNFPFTTTTLKAYGTRAGSPGSIYWKQNGGADTLLFDNNGVASQAGYRTPLAPSGAPGAGGTLSVSNVIVQNGAAVKQETSAWTFAITNSLGFAGSAALYIPSDGVLDHTGFGAWFPYAAIPTKTGANPGTNLLEY